MYLLYLMYLLHACMSVMYVCMSVCLPVCMYVCMYVYMYVYVQTQAQFEDSLCAGGHVCIDTLYVQRHPIHMSIYVHVHSYTWSDT